MQDFTYIYMNMGRYEYYMVNRHLENRRLFYIGHSWMKLLGTYTL